MSLIDFLVISLATFRLASLISLERGPYRMFSRFRVWAGESVAHDGERFGKNEFARMLVCLWCCSVWVGIVLGVSYYFYPAAAFWASLPFALSAVACVVNEVTSD